MSHRVRIIAMLCASFCGLPQAGAAEVKFRAVAEGAAPSTFDVKIYKGIPEDRKDFVAMIKNGTLVPMAVDSCTPATTYYARPISEAVYQYDPSEMYACSDGAEITFTFALRMVAKNYKVFFENDDPAAWGIDPVLTPAVKEMKSAYLTGDIGKAVKLSTELSNALAASGNRGKADAFRTLSLATTGIYVNSLASPDTAQAAPVPDAGLAKWNGRFEMTPITKEKLVEFQSTCGATTDQGSLGWKTMSCLPGGEGIQLRAYVPGSAVGG